MNVQLWATVHYPFVQILGIRFFVGNVDQAISHLSKGGGYAVAPSGTCFVRLDRDPVYREAMTNADLALPDSGAMVLLWRILSRQKLTRISGLRYIHALAAKLLAESVDRVLWVVPNEPARKKMEEWLCAHNFPHVESDLYVAPYYRVVVEDRELVAKIERQRPAHVIIGVGSGPQEKLGHYLRENLSYRPAIHCIGAALGFLTGDQVAIPNWADRFYLGWLFRLIAQPRIFVPRLARALALPLLIIKYGTQLPPMKRQAELGEKGLRPGGRSASGP